MNVSRVLNHLVDSMVGFTITPEHRRRLAADAAQLVPLERAQIRKELGIEDPPDNDDVEEEK